MSHQVESTRTASRSLLGVTVEHSTPVVTAYPKAEGRDLIWACCVSSIGPVCRHRQ